MPIQSKPTGWERAAWNYTQRPFADASYFNQKKAAEVSTWYDYPAMRTLDTPISGNDNRFIYGNWNAASLFYGTASDPVWTWTCDGPQDTFRNRARPDTTLYCHAPTNMREDADDTDHVIICVDLTDGTVIEMWEAKCTDGNGNNFEGTGTPHTVVSRDLLYVGYATSNVKTNYGAGDPAFSTIDYNDGVRATNFSWLIGLLTQRDFDRANAGLPIDHAFVIALTPDLISSSAPYEYPATYKDDGGANTGALRSGSLLGIPSTTTEPAGLSPFGSKLFTCLQEYGIYVGDACGGAWPTFYTEKSNLLTEDWGYTFTWWETHTEVTSSGDKFFTNRQIASNVATMTTSTDHGYTTGEWVLISGVGSNSYDGTRQVTGTPTSTTFTFSTPNADEASTSSSGQANNGVADFIKLWPLLRVANYDPLA